MPNTVYPDSAIAPARHCLLVVPNDATPLPFTTKALRANTAGNLVFRARNSSVDVTLAVVASEWIDVDAILVKVATTATIHAFG